QEDTGSRLWDRNGMRPQQAGEYETSLRLLGGAYQHGQTAGGTDEVGGNGQDGFEALDGSHGDYVEGVGGQSFGARRLYIDVRQCKGAGDFAEEGGLFVIGLDQSQADIRRPELHGNAWEACAGAYVGDFKTFNHRGH